MTYKVSEYDILNVHQYFKLKFEIPSGCKTNYIIKEW